MAPTRQEAPATIWEAIAALRDPTPDLDTQIAVSYLYRIHDNHRDEVHRRLQLTEEECSRCQSFEGRMREITDRLKVAFDGGKFADLAKMMEGAE